MFSCMTVGQGPRSRYSDSLRDGRFGVRTLVEASFLYLSRLALGPTQPPVQSVLGPCPGWKTACAWPWLANLHECRRWRKDRARHLFTRCTSYGVLRVTSNLHRAVRCSGYRSCFREWGREWGILKWKLLCVETPCWQVTIIRQQPWSKLRGIVKSVLAERGQGRGKIVRAWCLDEVRRQTKR
jgi:hypothetical protein